MALWGGALGTAQPDEEDEQDNDGGPTRRGRRAGRPWLPPAEDAARVTGTWPRGHVRTAQGAWPPAAAADLRPSPAAAPLWETQGATPRIGAPPGLGPQGTSAGIHPRDLMLMQLMAQMNQLAAQLQDAKGKNTDKNKNENNKKKTNKTNATTATRARARRRARWRASSLG